VVREALRLARGGLPAYSSPFSRKDFTRHQLLAIPALKTFLKTDDRGAVQFLADSAELPADLGLREVPNYSTLCYAEQRLLNRSDFVALLVCATAPATDRGLIGDKPPAAVDGTGLESRHRSRYYFQRAGRAHSSRLWTKRAVAVDTASHSLAAARVTAGPSSDSPQFRPVMARASLVVTWERVPADAAFDCEERHRYCRRDLRVRSTVTPINRRGRGRKWPKARCRRQMVRRFRNTPKGRRPRRVYGQRWQAESAFSRHKRRFGSSLGGRADASRERECRLRVRTHNLTPLAAAGWGPSGRAEA
jgi:hypothetical protein